MSYCTEIKKDLCNVRDLTRAQMTAMLFGMFYAGREQDGRRVIQSETADIIDVARTLSEAVFPKTKHDTKRFVRCGSSLFTFSCAFSDAQEKLFGDYTDISAAVSGEDSVSSAFLRGAFLSSGSITDPQKGYHLEISLSDEKRAEQLCSFIGEHGIEFRTSVRSRRRSADGTYIGEPVVYVKKSEVIEDFLTYIGAEMRAMEIMQIKIEKSVSNRVNRMLNCDSANLDKTMAAADRVCADIRLVLEKLGESGLKPALLSAAKLRLENPESSLSDLCEMFDPPLSRSGLNHRLKKLSEIAEQLRKDGV